MGMTTSATTQPFTGTYAVQPVPSTFAFAVRHSGAFWFRGVFSDVTGTLTGGGDGLALTGAARVDSISVHEPEALRAHLLAPDFFDAEHHPEVAFRSTAIRLAQDATVEVDGELTIRGVTRPVHAWGHWAPPRDAGFGEAAGLELHTSFDRRDFGLHWQSPLPGGGDAVSWEVEVDIDLLLLRAAEADDVA
jgi:polyisoprenoid-binding protein YceI